jgi:hypothetical protein
MKKVLGVVVFVTAGLLAFTREVPAAQTERETTPSQVSDDDLATQSPMLGCPSTAPVCCEPIAGGGCRVCVPSGKQCP